MFIIHVLHGLQDWHISRLSLSSSVTTIGEAYLLTGQMNIVEYDSFWKRVNIKSGHRSPIRNKPARDGG